MFRNRGSGPVRNPLQAAPDPSLGRHLGLPLLLFVPALLWLSAMHGDLWLADHLYAWQGHAWALRDGFVTESLIHETGKRLSVLAWLGVAGLFVASGWEPRLRAWRRPLLSLLVAVALGTGVVSVLKHVTDIDCPWSLVRYGGQQPYLGLFTPRPLGLPRGQCFPAGHASAGYAWVALYFFFLRVRPAWRWRGLAVGLVAGLLFGVSQQLRGAHFLSHDVSTLMIDWGVAVMCHRLFLRAPSCARSLPGPLAARRQGAAA